MTAILTTAVGVLLGVVGTLFVERRRWRREDLTRWHPERRNAYIQFLAATDRWVEAAWELTTHEGPRLWEGGMVTFDRDWSEESRAVIERLRLVVEGERARTVDALVEIEFLVSPEVTEAACDLRAHCFALHRAAEDDPPRDCGGVSPPLLEADDAWRVARGRFLDIARADVGVLAT